MRFNGEDSLWLESFTSDVNVVEVGQRVEQRLSELDAQPAGMEWRYVYNQPAEVDESVQNASTWPKRLLSSLLPCF